MTQSTKSTAYAATTHRAAQGETLNRIARRHGFHSADALYEHPNNATLRESRPDPEVLFPGDEVFIPAKEQKFIGIAPNEEHHFVLKRNTETLTLKLLDGSGEPLQGKRARLRVGEAMFDAELTADGLVELEYVFNHTTTGLLEVYLTEYAAEPTHSFALDIGHLDPIEEVTGVQARCNALGFHCGPVDGDPGPALAAALASFQKAQGLEESGEATAETRDKLKELHGC